jgi:hypothetical protein
MNKIKERVESGNLLFLIGTIIFSIAFLGITLYPNKMGFLIPFFVIGIGFVGYGGYVLNRAFYDSLKLDGVEKI